MSSNLKFGMMGWTQNDEVLATTRFGPDTDQRDYPLETEANEATETYDYPTLSTGAAMRPEIVRVAADTYWPTSAARSSRPTPCSTTSTMATTATTVHRQRPRRRRLCPGPRPRRHQHPLEPVANPENLAKLPADKPIVVYCYTGHTGQVATTVLGMLGYDVTNLKYGMMGWTEDDEVLATARYDPATSPDYAVEGTAVAAAAEEAAAEEAARRDRCPRDHARDRWPGHSRWRVSWLALAP